LLGVILKKHKTKHIILKNLNELQLFEGEIPRKEGEQHYSRDYVLKPEINPYLVYIVLKQLFGESNDDSFDEDKTQWAWIFSYNDFHIEIYDWKLFSTSIAIYHKDSDKEKSQELAENINDLLVKLALHNKSKLKGQIKESKHKILENPFVTYYSTAESLLELAKFTHEMSMSNASAALDKILSGDSTFSEEGIDLSDKSNDLYRSAFLMFLSSFEGFLNLMYELYLKEELRTDRLSERISREQIDIKLRLAPVYCNGFKTKTIDYNDNRFKNFLRLVNLRNDYVHANLIKSLERYIINEDDHTFIIENEETSEIPTNINELELKHVELAKKYIDEIVELVLESMEPKTKREFKIVISETEIQVIDEDGILIPLV
jgi:hypothetical protein